MTDDQNPTGSASPADATLATDPVSSTEVMVDAASVIQPMQPSESPPTATVTEPQPMLAEPSSAVLSETRAELPGETTGDRVQTEVSTSVATVAETPATLETAAPSESESEVAVSPAPSQPPAELKKPKKSRAKKAKSADQTASPGLTTEPTDTRTTPATEDSGTVAAGTASEEPPVESNKKWYAIKVQSGREESIKAAIERKVAIEGLEQYYGRIVIPMEEVIEKKQVRVVDKKTGEVSYQEKKVPKKRKKYHGYIFAELEFNDELLYLIRETSGVGDFVGIRPGAKGAAARPDPMPEHEVQAILTGISVKQKGSKPVKVKLDFEKGDRVKLREGAFANQEGEVKQVTEAKDPTDSPKVTVVVTIWGRPVEVVLDAWQVEKV